MLWAIIQRVLLGMGIVLGLGLAGAMWFERGWLRLTPAQPGGMRLEYDIEPAQGGWNGTQPLAEAEIAALKRRVDPDGMRELIWRPDGDTRLEVEVPEAAAGMANLNEEIDELKRLLKGSGVLEFHILANDVAPEEYQRMVQQLKTQGLVARMGDQTKWFEVGNNDVDEFKDRVVDYRARHYVLAYTTDDKSMTNGNGKPHWTMENATPGSGQDGSNIVEFQFDSEGSRLFGDLTANNLHQALGIVLDGTIISAPNINSRINGSGVISGGGQGGFTREEQGYLISVLNAGSLPAKLGDEPISEEPMRVEIPVSIASVGLFAGVNLIWVVCAGLLGYSVTRKKRGPPPLPVNR